MALVHKDSLDISGRPIGVFDSGIGGLTVVRELIRMLPAESVEYLGDTARVPYGVRSAETVRRYAAEGVGFLLSLGVKMLVIACNTVSAVGLEEIAASSPVPVVGVIKPGARAAAGATLGGGIGIIGTEATIRSAAYVRAIHELKPNTPVHGAACPLFVPLAEEGWTLGEVPVKVAEHYLAGLRGSGIDTLVLGCTHYPLLKEVIASVMGAGTRIIDSATETAAEVRAVLEAKGISNAGGKQRELNFHVTDSPAKFSEVGGRFLGQEIRNIGKITLEAFS